MTPSYVALPPAAPPASAPGPVYLAGPVVDFLLVGGLSILAFFGLTAFGTSVAAIDVNAFLIAYFVWIGNAPHFAATCQKLYRSRGNIAQYPFTATLVPFAVLGAVLLSVQYPARVAPYFIKLYLFWSPYHYSGQALGIALLYFRRAGFVVGRLERWLLIGATYGSFIASVARNESSVTSLSFFGIQYPTLGLPIFVAQAADVVLAACALALVVMLVLSARRQRRMPPIIALVPAVAQYFWFVRGPAVSSFFQLVPLFHGVQYLLVAWFAQMRERTEGMGRVATRGRLLWESVRWGSVAVLGGMFLFSGVPFLIQLATHRDLLLVMPIAIAGVQIHHFFVDGVIWKLKNPRVLSPLLGALRSTIGSVARPASRAA